MSNWPEISGISTHSQIVKAMIQGWQQIQFQWEAGLGALQGQNDFLDTELPEGFSLSVLLKDTDEMFCCC